jgi:hypothetical protein
MSKILWSKQVDIDGDDFVAEDGERYPINEFMRVDGESEYHGVMGLTNTSALAVTLDADGETATLACIT